jgi:hypothetical protein
LPVHGIGFGSSAREAWKNIEAVEGAVARRLSEDMHVAIEAPIHPEMRNGTSGKSSNKLKKK